MFLSDYCDVIKDKKKTKTSLIDRRKTSIEVKCALGGTASYVSLGLNVCMDMLSFMGGREI